jgi:amino acid adenylation domain-containing protein
MSRIVNLDDGFTTIQSLIDRMAQSHPQAPFLISPETGRSLSFLDIRQQSRHLFNQFRQAGLTRGDKIAFLLDNGLFTAQLFLGAMYGGFVAVPLNVRAGVKQLSYSLNHCDAKIVYVGKDYDGLISQIMADVPRPVRVISADVDGIIESTGADSATAISPLSPDDAAMLMYTSGSTGQPKAAIHTQANILAHARNSIASHQLTAADRSLLVLPLYHINAECVTLIPTLASGGSVVIPHRFSVSQFWDWLDEHQCTWTAIVPTIVSQLLDWKDPKADQRAESFARIRFMRSSSAQLSPSLHREFLEKFKLPLIQAMGSTECGNIFCNPVPPGENKIGSVGLPWGFEARIVSRDGIDVPEGECGEILLRGPAVMQAYFKDSESTSAALDPQRWLRTGDLAYRDNDGYFFVVGRSKELIIKGGVNIAPKQVDEVLESHPSVLEAAALGIPDRYLGEDVIAFVVTRAGITGSETELLSFCETRLGQFKTPTRIHFVKDLPKGPSGKVQRLKLLEHAAAAGSHAESGNGDHSAAQTHPEIEKLPVERIIAQTWSDVLGIPTIDAQSNFFALGGHSLLAIQCLSRMREKLPVALSLSDFFEHATVAEQVALVKRRFARDVNKHRVNGEKAGGNGLDKIPPRDPSQPIPLSSGQHRLWFLEQLHPGLPVYNEVEAVRLRGELNVAAMEKAINQIVARHEIFRSTVEVIDGQPMVVVHKSWPLRLKKIDLSVLPPSKRDAEVERLLVDEPRRLYHLEVEPGIRTTLLRLGPDDHVFILMMHHIVCDWSSEGVFWRELSSLYRSNCRNEPPALAPLPIQFGDYAAWQIERNAKADFGDDLKYWEETLRGAPELMEIPTDRPRPRYISYRGNKQRFKIDKSLANAVREQSRREKISLFTVFAGALETMLYRYSGQQDIVLGIPMADRDTPELASLIGFLLQNGILRTQVSGEMTFRQLLASIQKSVLGLYNHRAVPFERIVGKLKPERSLSYNPLIQVMLNWRDRDQQLQFIGMDGLQIETLLSGTKTSKFDLVLVLTDGGDDIWAELEYNSDLFDDSRIERMFGHYIKLLAAAAANPDGRLDDLEMLTDSERRLMLADWNRTDSPYPKDRCVHELVQEQAKLAPDAIATVCGKSQLTYRQLNARANQLAHHLQNLGVRPDTLVAVCVERSCEMIVALLGILKAGGAYVPLDPGSPAERLSFMIHDSGAPVLLTQNRLRDQLRVGSSCKVICIDTDWPTIAQSPAENPARSAGPTNLAYTIYTSGSTGEPKGVELNHHGLLNLIFWHRRTYNVTPADRATQLAGVGFDASVWELWPYLTAGAAIIMPDEETRLLPEKLRDWLVQHCITLSFVPTPLAEAMIGLPWPEKISLRAMLTGGDRLNRLVPANLPFKLINHYGPTESTVVTTCCAVEVEGPKPKAPPIGRPIDNTQVYLLDHNQRPVPIGIPGELHIGGDSLARGYLRRPELTTKKFIPNPFDAARSARLYNTGDLARYLPDGTIEFVGRNDDQVKIRGFRIELGEIESVLAAHPAVRAAAVMAREDGGGEKRGEKRLVAYVTTQPEVPAVDELREHLKNRMPDYMIPSAFVILDQFPLTTNGKVDRAALPAPDDENMLIDEAGDAPATEVEKTVAGILASLLGLQQVDAQANFFALGGHSLLGTQLIARIRDAFGINLPLRRVFEAPTVAELSADIEEILLADVEAMSDDEAQASLAGNKTGSGA